MTHDDLPPDIERGGGWRVAGGGGGRLINFPFSVQAVIWGGHALLFFRSVCNLWGAASLFVFTAPLCHWRRILFVERKVGQLSFFFVFMAATTAVIIHSPFLQVPGGMWRARREHGLEPLCSAASSFSRLPVFTAVQRQLYACSVLFPNPRQGP